MSARDRQSDHLLAAEMSALCDSASLSEDGIREIIQQHGLTPSSSPNVITDYNFFLKACSNNYSVSVGIIQLLLEYFPAAINARSEPHGSSPLHVACINKHVTLGIIQLLIDSAPDSVRRANNDGCMPLHELCANNMDEKEAIEILKLLLEKCPESIRHSNNHGHLPIHFASMEKSPEFCRVLIEAYPGSEQIKIRMGELPLHLACRTNTLATVEYLYNLYPDSVNQAVVVHGGYPIRYYPIHIVMMSQKLTPAVDIVRFLLDCDPDVKLQKIQGLSLLHYASCGLAEDDDSKMAAIKILKLLLEKCPESIRHTDNKDNLPIHQAAKSRSPEFCRVLIEAYPGSERISNDNGELPLHLACLQNTLATVEFLYKLYPDAVNHAVQGWYPTHVAIASLAERNSATDAVDIVQFFLDCDPNVKFQKVRGLSLLHYACGVQYDDSHIEVALQIIKAIYDAHPEAIEDNRLLSSILRCHQQVQTFINGELVHARQAKNHRQMTTRYGRLRLHRALQNNVTLGSIKLLVKGNPSAIRTSDNNGALPLHLACEYHNSPRVIQYFLDLNATTLDVVDRDGNTALHYSCRGAKYGAISLLLERYDAISVSKRNAQQKLPIDLLWESDKVEDRESVGYLDSVFRLLKAYPEMLMNIGLQMQQRACEVGKKRKFGAV